MICIIRITSVSGRVVQQGEGGGGLVSQKQYVILTSIVSYPFHFVLFNNLLLGGMFNYTCFYFIHPPSCFCH